jgi:hypothetical protein
MRRISSAMVGGLMGVGIVLSAHVAGACPAYTGWTHYNPTGMPTVAYQFAGSVNLGANYVTTSRWGECSGGICTYYMNVLSDTENTADGLFLVKNDGGTTVGGYLSGITWTNSFGWTPSASWEFDSSSDAWKKVGASETDIVGDGPYAISTATSCASASPGGNCIELGSCTGYTCTWASTGFGAEQIAIDSAPTSAHDYL